METSKFNAQGVEYGMKKQTEIMLRDKIMPLAIIGSSFPTGKIGILRPYELTTNYIMGILKRIVNEGKLQEELSVYDRNDIITLMNKFSNIMVVQECRPVCVITQGESSGLIGMMLNPYYDENTLKIILEELTRK